MWYASETALEYRKWPDTLVLSAFFPDWARFPGQIVTVPPERGAGTGYDDWVQRFPRIVEQELVANAISSQKEHPRRVHIAGISCAESIELLREHYRSQWYEDALAKNYVLPPQVLLTASVSLRHLLWCEKDKGFLSTIDTAGQPYYALVPPLRSPRDLRALQQAARMGILSGVDLFPGDEEYLPSVLCKQILSPFQMSQLLSFRWKRYGFPGTARDIVLPLPSFSALSGELD